MVILDMLVNDGIEVGMDESCGIAVIFPEFDC